MIANTLRRKIAPVVHSGVQIAA